MFFSWLKNFMRGFFSSLVAFGLLFIVWSMGATRFPTIEGERTYYLHSQSSQALIKKKLSPLDFALVKGESVQFACTEDFEVDKILADLGGEVLFREKVGETTSYYAYSPNLRGGVQLGTHFVNLHIAVRGETCVVGSPIIFGGF